MGDKIYDVIVVGGGNAALCAALSAYDGGAKVAVLEAASLQDRGGNTRFAGCIFRFPHKGMEHIMPLLSTQMDRTHVDRCTLEPYTPEDFRREMQSTTGGRTDPKQTELIIEKAYDTVRWMADYGVKWELLLNKYFNPQAIKGEIKLMAGGPIKAMREGIGLSDDLWRAVEKTQIDVYYDTPAHDLIINGDTVSGIKTRGRDSYINFYGQVVLACGGFEANPAMRRKYLGVGWDLVVVRGTKYNTGTMLERALNAGARACGHWGGCHASPQDISAPLVGDITRTPITPRYSYPFGISVNLEAKRFFDEGEEQFALTYAKTGARIGAQTEAKAFQIFDQKCIHMLEPRYATVEPTISNTIEGLAEKLGLNPSDLRRTVDEFNAACPPPGPFDGLRKDGRRTAPDLTPPKSNWSFPIDQGPFHAYTVTCGITFTYGGIQVNTHAQVLNNEGRPMPGLWAAGEITGGMFYHNYAGGAGLTKGAVFGRIAGSEAATRSKLLKTKGASHKVGSTSDLVSNGISKKQIEAIVEEVRSANLIEY